MRGHVRGEEDRWEKQVSGGWTPTRMHRNIRIDASCYWPCGNREIKSIKTNRE